MSRTALALVVAYALLPFAGLLNENREQGVRAADLLPHFLIALLPALLAVLAVAAWRGRAAGDRAAVVVAAGLFVFFHFHTVASGLGQLGVRTFSAQLLAWTVAFLAAVCVAYAADRRTPVRRYMLAVGLALVALSAVQYASAALTSASDANEAAPPAAAPAPAAAERPNVYFFLLDGYGRRDLLAEQLGFDNGPFVERLASRGFDVASRAIANYPHTHLSLSSTLDMRYLVEDASDLDDRYRSRLDGHNGTVRQLRALGYRYALAPDGSWDGLGCSGAEDLCIEPRDGPGLGGRLRETDWAVLNLTPLGGTAQRLLPGGIGGPYTTPERLVDGLEDERLPEPYFAFNHTVSPHPPYRFTPDCGIKEVRHLFSAAWNRRSYLDNLRCVNTTTLAAVDRIVRRDPTAIVVVQGDHGTAFELNVGKRASDWTADDMRERFPVLSAIRAPARCRASLPNDLTLVNTFRLVLACIRGDEPELLDDRAYVARYREGGVAEVPARLVRGRFER